MIGDRLTEPAIEEFEHRRPALPDDLVQLQDRRRAATADLLAALSSRDVSEAAVWSWFAADQTVGFTWRMQTHEATMHRVDAELAAGLPTGGIDPEVATDRIDHMLDVMRVWPHADAARRITGTIELQAADTGKRWLANTIRWSGQAWGQAFTDQPGCIRTSAGEPDAIITGTAENLDLLVWTRANRETLVDR